MSFVGKILVVIQLVLSVMFMAFAGAVYTAHLKWRDEALKQKAAVAQGDKKRADLETEISKIKAESAAKLTAADQLAAQLDAARKGLEADVARLKKESGDLQVARKTASGQSLIAAEDAEARKSEADNQRAINHELTATRDAEFAARVKQEDARRSLELALEAATAKKPRPPGPHGHLPAGAGIRRDLG
jgi:chromosome segregation ATPase